MIAMLVLSVLVLVVASSWLTVAHWVRTHFAEPAPQRPRLTVIQGGRPLG